MKIGVPKVFLGIILLLLHFSLRAQTPELNLSRTFGLSLSTPFKLEFDQEGNMVVLEHNILKTFDQNGNLLKKLNLVRDNDPGTFQSFELDKEGNFYLVDVYHSSLQKVTAAGEVVMKVGSEGSGPRHFRNPNDLALDKEGNIYVADTQNNRIQKLNSKGEFLKSFVFPGDTTHKKAVAIEAAPSGTLYVLGIYGKLYKLTQDLQLIDSMQLQFEDTPTYHISNSLGLDQEENIYVFYTSPGRIDKYSSSGKFLKSFASSVNGTKIFTDGLIETTVAEDGEVYVTNRSSNGTGDIQIFGKDGEFKRKIGNQAGYIGITQDDQGQYFLLQENPTYSIQLYNSFGVFVKEFDYTGREGGPQWTPVTIKSDRAGNIYCLEINSVNTGLARIQKFSNEGKFIKTAVEVALDPANYDAYRKGDFHIDSYGNFFLLDCYRGTLKKYNQLGFVVSTLWLSTNNHLLYMPTNLAMDLDGNMFVLDIDGYRISKFNHKGELLHVFQTPKPAGFMFAGWKPQASSMQTDAQGNLYLWNGVGNIIRVYNPSGTQINQINGSSGFLSFNRNSNKLLVLNLSYVNEHISGAPEKVSVITGKIFKETSSNCLPDVNDVPVSGIVVKAEPGPYFGISNEMGLYTIPVDTGTYIVTPILPSEEAGRDITLACLPSNKVPVKSFLTQVAGPNIGLNIKLTPFLNVNVSSSLRRRCFQNVTTVAYSNSGFAPAQNAQVKLQLPPEVIFISASLPHYQDHKGNYVFEVGDLKPGQQGTISIIDSVSCDDPSIRGLTVCTKAWITPANAKPEPASWNKAEIAVSGASAENTQVRFVIQNQGSGNMTDSLSYRVLQDTELSLNSRYKLASGDSLVLRFPTSGRVIRVEADQPVGNPIKATASANVEIKKRNNGLPAIPMMAFPIDDPEPEITEQCLPIVDSFDPNDKQVEPVGLTAEHYTPFNTPLRYTVRFQNTGTDVAYRVVVVDTLSADVDLATLQMGTVSHPYKLSVTGKERPVLTFTFNNIMLPDSSVDQAKSNGSIQFSIKPKANLPDKHLIENFADIFFDYNEPVRTNTTINRLHDLPQVVKSDQQLSADDVVASPSITGFTPSQSRAGQLVIITGKNFGLIGSKNQVLFNAVQAQVIEASETRLKVVVPTNTLTGKIKVVTPDGAVTSSNDYVIFQPPVFTAVTPMEAVPGEVITITGKHFSSVASQDTLTINGVQAQVLEATETQLKVGVPETVYSGKIMLKTLGGQVETTESFKIWHHPVIASFSPAGGKQGTQVVITGTKFSGSAHLNKVLFNNQLAEVVSAQPTSLTVKVPNGATTGLIKVETEHGYSTSSSSFQVYQPPVISGFSPAEGRVGAEVTLEGSHLSEDLVEKVFLGTIPCSIIGYGLKSIKVLVPADAVSGRFSIQSKGGQTQSTSAYHVWYPPVISEVDKARERVGGNLTLTGRNFAEEAQRNKVLFGDKSAQVLQSAEYQLTVRIPIGAVSGQVTVNTPGGTATHRIDIIPAPVITKVNPTSASVGTVVELYGQDFMTLNKRDTVYFAGVEALIISTSPSLLKVQVPRGAVTGKVAVAGAGGTAEADFQVEELSPDQAIQVYPNPTPDRFTVDFIKADFDVLSVQVFDVAGKLLYTAPLPSGQLAKAEINLPSSPAGIYVLVVQTSKGKVIKRIHLL
ncbi:IPT/TIG domain-containing protein [Rufibacter hautae]|uniref:T9SS type A sorting domain-containing protein n=1 Tax=Rufibacter hautae TaxID=2595005 RepID=A0A5B6TB85_9BACT|nr:IPT/TIG domain-containing protein [Rufibacter hautae]KAA3437739.1 T9SS type A sorting domain-containing protein [Rufibacter hautae]